MQPARDAFSNNNNRVVPLRQGSQTGNHATMSIVQARRARQVKIGRILLLADLITQECLNEALSIAQDLQQPIGKVLTSTQQVSDIDLQSALLAQSMMAEGLVEEYVAIESLKLAAREGITFGQALDTVKYVANQKSPLATDLEDLLLNSGMVSATVLDEAKKQSLESDASLGSCLMSTRAIVFAHLNFVFECITLISENRISKQAAIKALADIKKENIDLGQALKRQKLSPKSTQSKLKLGDLLTAGSVISEKDNLAAVERALTEKRLIGEILVKSGLISPELLNDALTMQNMVIKGVVSRDEAAFVLRQVVAEKKEVGQVLLERRSLQDDASTAGQALDLLLKAKLVEPQAVPQAMAQQQKYQMDALKALVASDVVSANVCRAAIECARLVVAGTRTQQDAVSILHHCDRSRGEFEQALRELGFDTMLEDTANLPIVEPPKEKTMPTWTTSFEFWLAVVVVLGGIAGGVATLLFYPAYLGGYCICGVVLLVGLTFLVLGKMWEGKVKEKKRELKQQEEQAKQQVNRLVKIRSKETF